MEQIVYLLTHYGYFILFPLAVVEGPIISVISGLLCATKILNPFIVIPVIVSGDVIGDSFYYSLGRWRSRKALPKMLRNFSPSAEKMERVNQYFDAHPIKTIFLSKVILGIGLAGLYLAGNAKIPYIKFLIICLCASLFQCSVYLSLGFLFGTAYQQIGQLLNSFATFTLMAALAVAVFFAIKSMLKKI